MIVFSLTALLIVACMSVAFTLLGHLHTQRNNRISYGFIAERTSA